MAKRSPNQSKTHCFSKSICEDAEKILKRPEFSEMKDVIENNIAHKNTSVYKHTLDVHSRVTNLLTFTFIDESATRLAALKYFNQKIGKHTRGQLLEISTLLHDLGKTKTIVFDETGTSSCPGHEIVGALLATQILRDCRYSTREIDYILTIIKVHSGFPIHFLNYLEGLNKREVGEIFGKYYFLPEVFIYMVADNETASTFRKYVDLILLNILQNSEIYRQLPESKIDPHIATIIQNIREENRKFSKPWPLNARLFHLSEEVGELNDVYLQYLGLKDRKQSLKDIRNGLNDILVDLIAIYDLMGLDLSKSLKVFLDHDEARE